MVRGFEWVRMEWGWSGDGKDGSKGRIIAAKSENQKLSNFLKN